MPNDFDAAWNSSWTSQSLATGEDAQLNGVNVKVVVLFLERAERVGQFGGRGATSDGEVEISREQWTQAHGRAGSSLFLRGKTYEIPNEPTDPEDSGTVVLSLVAPGGN